MTKHQKDLIEAFEVALIHLPKEEREALLQELKGIFEQHNTRVEILLDIINIHEDSMKFKES